MLNITSCAIVLVAFTLFALRRRMRCKKMMKKRGKYMRASEKALAHIKGMNFCGLCTTGDCKRCDKLSTKDEAIKALEKKVEYDREEKGYIFCNDCEYTTSSGTYEECIIRVSNDGGYVRSDKDGGQDDECPICGNPSLQWES